MSQVNAERNDRIYGKYIIDNVSLDSIQFQQGEEESQNIVNISQSFVDSSTRDTINVTRSDR